MGQWGGVGPVASGGRATSPFGGSPFCTHSCYLGKWSSVFNQKSGFLRETFKFLKVGDYFNIFFKIRKKRKTPKKPRNSARAGPYAKAIGLQPLTYLSPSSAPFS